MVNRKKLLGIKIDHILKVYSHIDEICKKASCEKSDFVLLI